MNHSIPMCVYDVEHVGLKERKGERKLAMDATHNNSNFSIRVHLNMNKYYQYVHCIRSLQRPT